MEDIYSEAKGLFFNDTEACATLLHRAAGELKALRVDKDTWEYALGCVDAVTVTHCVSSLGQVTVDSARADRELRASKNGPVHSVVTLALAGTKGKGPWQRYLLQHHLQRSVWSYGSVLTRMNRQTSQQLRELLVVVAQPVLIAVKEAPTVPIPRQDEIQRGFPPHRPFPASCQYAIAMKVPFGSTPGSSSVLMPGLKMELWKAIKVSSHSHRDEQDDDEGIHTFLSWKFQSASAGGGGQGPSEELQSDRAPPALLASVNALKNQLAPLQRDLTAVVHLADGVGFSGEVTGSNSGLFFAWDDRWQSMRTLIDKHGGFFRTGRLDTFRLLGGYLCSVLILILSSPTLNLS